MGEEVINAVNLCLYPPKLPHAFLHGSENRISSCRIEFVSLRLHPLLFRDTSNQGTKETPALFQTFNDIASTRHHEVAMDVAKQELYVGQITPNGAIGGSFCCIL